MNGKVKAFLKRKDVVFSASRYGIDALGAMAQGLFASLLIGTILSTLGEQLGIAVLVTIGGYAKAATGPAMAVAIGYALKTPQLVLFSLIAVGAAANELGKAGGPLAVLVVAIVASECGKIVSKETKIDIIVTPAVTLCGKCHHVGDGASALLHGHPRLCAGWRGTDPSDQQRGHLRGIGTDRSCRRSGCSWLLCPDDRFCSDEL